MLFKWRTIIFRRANVDAVKYLCSNSAHYSTTLRSGVEHSYGVSTYNDVALRSLSDPVAFWEEQANKLTWTEKWHTTLDVSNYPHTKWFAGGKLNVCYNAVDRHVEAGNGDRNAIVFDSPVTNYRQTITYRTLLSQVELCAGAIAKHGVSKGDRVLIYMPMIPQALITMLACARIGAVHSVVFGGFAAKELAVRLNHCEAKMIVTASAGVEPNRVQNYKPIVDQAIELSAAKPTSVLVYQRPNIGEVNYTKGRDFNWDEEMNAVLPHPCVDVEANDPLYILYTSGTTGDPKGVIRPSGGYAVMLPWSMQTIYGVEPSDTWWAASDLGWVVGHSYICYGPLLYGMTSVLYEGKPIGTPDAGQYFRVIAENNVKSMFVAPTALRAIRQHDFNAEHGKQHMDPDEWSLKTLFAAGEHLDIETRLWAEREFNVPVLDHWWQTESGFPLSATCAGCTDVSLNPPKDASGKPVPGCDIQVLHPDTSMPVKTGKLGRIVIKMPLPPGFMSGLWKNEKKYQEAYFEQYPGYYDTMDAGNLTEDGYVAVMARADDVINVAGHRLSCGAIEEAIMEVSVVVECAVVGMDDKLKGSIPIAFVVLHPGEDYDYEHVGQSIVEMVRKEIGPVASFKRSVIVSSLPKTRSGKVARSTLAAMCNGKPYKIPVTIDDPSVYNDIKNSIIKSGLNLSVPDPS